MGKPILCLDFDGVIHSYTSGWKGIDVIPDPPVEGAKEFIEMASEYFEIVIHSSRCADIEGIAAIEGWLFRYQFPYVKIVALKPPAFLTIDDRAITFDGIWPDIRKLMNFEPWKKKLEHMAEAIKADHEIG